MDKKFRNIKISLKQILQENINRSDFDNIIYRTNDVITHAYQFLRLWILTKYQNYEEIPLISKDLIGMCLKVLTHQQNKRGPKPKGDNLKIFNEFIHFNNNIYSKLGYPISIDGTNLSSIFNYTETEILTCIENNIKANFFKYIDKFVDKSFKSFK